MIWNLIVLDRSEGGRMKDKIIEILTESDWTVEEKSVGDFVYPFLTICLVVAAVVIILFAMSHTDPFVARDFINLG